MRGRTRWLPLVVVLLVAVPVLEVWLLVQVGQRIGALATVAVLVVEALLGAWLARREGLRSWRALEASVATGQVPTRELSDAVLVLTGAVLLMLPGLVTDLVGLLVLLPFTRPAARRLLGWVVARRLRSRPLPSRPTGTTVIEGEVVDGPGQTEGPPPVVPGTALETRVR